MIYVFIFPTIHTFLCPFPSFSEQIIFGQNASSGHQPREHLILDGILIFRKNLCGNPTPSLIRKEYRDLTENFLSLVSIHKGWYFSPCILTSSHLCFKLFQSSVVSLVKVLLKLNPWHPLFTASATEMLWSKLILYSLGCRYFRGLDPTHQSSQNLVSFPSPNFS